MNWFDRNVVDDLIGEQRHYTRAQLDRILLEMVILIAASLYV